MIWFASLLFICNEINNRVKNLGGYEHKLNAYEDRIPVDAPDYLKLKLMRVHM
jgi:hypothetical protein